MPERTVRFLTTIDVVLEEWNNCSANNKWLDVKHVSIVFGQTYVKDACNGYGTSMETIKQWKYCWYLVFSHYIWFIESENLYFILVLKDKMTRFWHLIFSNSLILE